MAIRRLLGAVAVQLAMVALCRMLPAGSLAVAQ